MEFDGENKFSFGVEDNDGRITETVKGSVRLMSNKVRGRVNHFLEALFEGETWDIRGSLFTEKIPKLNGDGDPELDDQNEPVEWTKWERMTPDDRFSVYAFCVRAQNPDITLDQLDSLSFNEVDSLVSVMFGIPKGLKDQLMTKAVQADFLLDTPEDPKAPGIVESAESSNSVESETVTES